MRIILFSSGTKLPFQNIDDGSHQNIHEQNDNRNKRDGLDQRLRIKLWNQQRQRHISEIRQKRDRGDCHHGIYEDVAIHFQQRLLGGWKIYIQQHSDFPDSQGQRHIFQIMIKLQERIVCHQVWR